MMLYYLVLGVFFFGCVFVADYHAWKRDYGVRDDAALLKKLKVYLRMSGVVQLFLLLIIPFWPLVLLFGFAIHISNHINGDCQ